MFTSTGNRNSCWDIVMVWMFGLLTYGADKKIFAQEQVFFGQHSYNRMIYNPAFAGDKGIPGFTLFSRQQWMSWEGSPSANMLVVHSKMKDQNAGLGVSLGYDRMGPVQRSELSGMYSYNVKISEQSELKLGIQAEIRLLQVRLSQLELVDQGDLLFAEDPGLKPQPNFGLGAVYNYDNYSLSISIPRLLNPGLSPYAEETSSLSSFGRLFYLGATSSYDLSPDLVLVPSFLLALSEGRTPFLELAALLYYQDMVGFGFLYRLNQTLGAMVRYMHHDKMVFGYAYDISLGKLRNNVGTHELFFGFNFAFNKAKTVSPRRF